MRKRQGQDFHHYNIHILTEPWNGSSYKRLPVSTLPLFEEMATPVKSGEEFEPARAEAHSLSLLLKAILLYHSLPKW